MKKRIILSLLIGALTATSALPVMAAPKQMADGNIFDAEYYAANYADVAAVLGTEEAALYNHYVNFGKNEGRKPCADGASVNEGSNTLDNFDVAYYIANNPDVVAVLGTEEAALYNHYVNFGKNEGRKPCADSASREAAVPSTNETAETTNNPATAPFELNVMYFDNKGLPYMYLLDYTAPGYKWTMYDFAIASLKEHCATAFAGQPGSQYAPALTCEDVEPYQGIPMDVCWVRGVCGYDYGTFDTRGIALSWN